MEYMRESYTLIISYKTQTRAWRCEGALQGSKEQVGGGLQSPPQEV